MNVSKIIIPNEDHFTLVERLTEPDYTLTKVIVHYVLVAYHFMFVDDCGLHSAVTINNSP